MKRFKALYIKVIGRYQQKEDRVLNGLEMALNKVLYILYNVDIQQHNNDNNNWILGEGICIVLLKPNRLKS